MEQDLELFVGLKKPMDRCPSKYKRSKKKAKRWRYIDSDNCGDYTPPHSGRSPFIFINPRIIWQHLPFLVQERRLEIQYKETGRFEYVPNIKDGLSDKELDRDEEDFEYEFIITLSHEYLHYLFNRMPEVRRWMAKKPGNLKLKEEPFIEKIELLLAMIIYLPQSGPRWYPF